MFRVLVERYQGPLFGLLGRVPACALAATLGLARMGQVMGLLVP